LVLADTDNNRVLIWNTIPTTIDQPADIVLGQPNFTTAGAGAQQFLLSRPAGRVGAGNATVRGRHENSRVMIWNSIPTSNNQPADVVLGEPNFTTAPPATTSDLPPTASNLFNPVSVTSDGQHLYVTDLGHNRVLIWNSIPTQNGQAADVVVGQPNMTSGGDNDAPHLRATGTTPTESHLCLRLPDPFALPSARQRGNPIYPGRCGLPL
jgi:hypothetical protein